MLQPEAASAPENGHRFLAEIREQPDALARLLEHEGDIARIAATARERGVTLVRMVGHGSSDNAASFGVYAFGLLPRWTALRDSIALEVYYHSSLDMTGSMVVALSQSGRTPDVVEYVIRARRNGAFTVAVTNDPESELASAAEATLPLAAGPELAVAATKTYLNTVAALALLAAHCAEDPRPISSGIRSAIDALGPLVSQLEGRVPPIAVSLAFVGRMFVIGRGVEFATAREIALKLLETCRVAAEPLTATDLAHGPVAALDPQFPVWTIASRDEMLPVVLDAAVRARDMGATIVASGTAAEAVEGAAFVLPVPATAPALLSPLLSVVPGQVLAWALARAKGLDPDHPRGLSKVTLAK